MKKIIILLIIAILLGLGMAKFAGNQLAGLYDKGFQTGKESVTLEDVCIDPESAGVSANFETGEYFEWVRCKTNFRDNIRVQDIFEPEGDWDVCSDLNEDDDFDDEGECRPAARDNKWVD